MRPKLLLAGLGETGSRLAQMLGANWDLVVVDSDAAALEDTEKLESGADSVVTHHGDATSAVVLRKLPRDGMHAAVGCAGSDEANFEFLRLAHDVLGIENRFALMHSFEWEDRYHAENIEVVSQDRTCAAVLAARVNPGQHHVAGIGLGQGEIVQVEVLPNSSVIGRRLADLHPRRWLVGAVYREGQLVVPHGDTVLEAGDSVLLIGEPEILPSIATLIRTGESEFPLQYGSHVVALCGPLFELLLDEIEYLIAETRVEQLEVVACEAEAAQLAKTLAACEGRGIPCQSSCSAQGTIESLLEEVRRRDVGVLAVPPERLSLTSRVGLGRSRTAKIIDLLNSPALVSRKTFPYRRILLALAELPFHMAAAQLGIDLARMVGAELHLGVVQQPIIVEGVDHRAEIDERRREIENLAGLYHLKIATDIIEGNPIHELERMSGDFDLLVLPYPKGRKSFLTRPDVGLNLIHRAACSVMVMPQ